MQRRPLLLILYLIGLPLFAFSQEVDITTTRTINGKYNNLFNPDWGSADENLLRLTDVAYEDGISSPARQNGPAPRLISNTIFAQEGLINDPLNLSDFCWVWGQFIDHDIGLTPDGPEDATMSVPAGDPYFDPFGGGQAVIPMRRNVYDPATGTGIDNPRQHPNKITAFIDGSAVYGSTEERARWLRTFEGGKLKVSEGNLLPYNTVTGEEKDAIDEHHPEMDNPVGLTDKFFVAGDARANENPLLASFHTLFVREHNRLCDEFAKQDPDLTDEQIYQHARKMVGAFIQAIVYQEWLPAMGVELPPYAGYNANVNPQMLNVFTGAAYRLGHTLLNSTIRRMNNDGRIMPGGNIALKDAFFNPGWIKESGDIDPFFKGMATQTQQMLDPKVIDDVRNFLFGPPGAGGLDLASININRGRERGLPDFNTLRQNFGLTPLANFQQLTARPGLFNSLKDLYGDINTIDPWVGLLAEQPMPNALFGETIMAIMKYQFTALRDGDRFYFENDPVLHEKEKIIIKRTTLQDIIMRNTHVKLMQSNVFKAMPHSEICDNLMVDVSGNIQTEDGRPLQNVSLLLEFGDEANEVLSSNDGEFAFSPVPGCDVKRLQLHKNDNVANGVTTLDLILVTKHILGAKKLDSPYKIIAADVDKSNSLSVIDLVRLRKVILSIYSAFPNNTVWRFVPEDFEFSDPANPFLDEIPDLMSFDLLGGDLDQEFIAVKVGDVNSSVNVNNIEGALVAETSMELQMEDRFVRAGERVEVVISNPQISRMEGFQFSLDYDESALIYDLLEEGDLSNQSLQEHFGVFEEEGIITTSWNRVDEKPRYLDARNPVVFRANFIAMRDGRLSEFIKLNNEKTISEAYDNQLQPQKLNLKFTEGNTEGGEFVLYQNRPNPARNQTFVPFKLPAAGSVSLIITNLSGQVVFTARADFPAGSSQWELGRDVLPAAGAYFYMLDTEFGRNTRKMIVVD